MYQLNHIQFDAFSVLTPCSDPNTIRRHNTYGTSNFAAEYLHISARFIKMNACYW